MRWSELLEFMCARDPGFAATLVPVPRDAIAACERGLGVTLPAFYVEFLAAMGAGSGRYHPFGRHDHNFYRLVRRIPRAHYPTDRYFRVASHDDPSVDVEQEPYLDLTRAADGDTPLVTVDQAGGFQPEHVRGLPETLAEELAINAFSSFESAPRGHTVGLSAGAESTPEILRVHDAAIECLEIMGLSVLLTPSRRLVYLGSSDLAACVEAHGSLITTLAVDLSGADPIAARDAAEQLAAAVPGLAMRPPSRRFSRE